MNAKIIALSLVVLTLACQTKKRERGKLLVIEQDWEKAKTMADRHDKLILIDFYTSWCGPCKVFDAQLKDSIFADSLATHYLVFKYNAEKDDSIHLALKHHVTTYPTYILSTPDGQIISKQYGRFEETPESISQFHGFLHQGAELHQDEKYLTGISPETNLEIPEFYTQHLRREASYKEDDWNTYWENHPFLENETEFAVLLGLGGTQEQYAHLLQNRDSFEQRYGPADVYHALENYCHTELEKAIRAKDENHFDTALRQARQLFNEEDAHDFIPKYEELFWFETEQWELLTGRVNQQIQSGELTPSDLNRYAWKIQEYCSDPRANQQAMHWMDSLIQIDSSYAHLDTYAWLLYRAGEKDKALKTIRIGIKKGEALGENMAFSRELETLLNAEI